jgi:hypothetical protein
MIEPHSAQLGASSWILKATFALPSDSVTVPDPFDFGAAAACPFVAMTANSSLAALPAPTLGVPAASTGEPATAVGASSFTAVAVGASLDADAPRSARGGSS